MLQLINAPFAAQLFQSSLLYLITENVCYSLFY